MWTKEDVNLTSSFWHLTSAYSLERQETQIFLFLPLFFGSSLARLRTPTSSRVPRHNCSPFTFPCVHSLWWGQQQTAWNGMTNDTEAQKTAKNQPLKLFVTIYKHIYNYERAKRLEKKELMKPEFDQDGGHTVKYETRSSNPRTLVCSHPNLPTKYKTIGRNNTFPLFDISDLQSSFSAENSGKNAFWPIKLFHFN